MASLGFQYEPMSLDVNEVCLEEEQDIPICMKNLENFEVLLNCVYV